MFATGLYEIRNTQNQDDPEYGVLTVGQIDGAIWPLSFVPVDNDEAWPLDLTNGTYEFKAVNSSKFPAGGPARTSRMSLGPFPAIAPKPGEIGACQTDPGPFAVDNQNGELILIGIFAGNNSSYVYSDQGLIERSDVSWPITLEINETATLKYSSATTPKEVDAIADEEFGENQVRRSLYERTP